MKFLGLNQGPLYCDISFEAWVEQKKSCVYKQIMHILQENLDWSGSGVEQKSGTSHLFNLSTFDLLALQLLMS